MVSLFRVGAKLSATAIHSAVKATLTNALEYAVPTARTKIVFGPEAACTGSMASNESCSHSSMEMSFAGSALHFANGTAQADLRPPNQPCTPPKRSRPKRK